MADKSHRVDAGRKLRVGEPTAEKWRLAERSKRIGQREPGGDAFRAARCRQIAIAEVESEHALDRCGAVKVEKLGRREHFDIVGVAQAVDPRKRRTDGDDARRLGVGERVQDEAVDGGEDGAVAANGERPAR